MKNAISWFQIPVVDFDRAVKFYSAIFSEELTTTKAMGNDVAPLPHDHEGGAVGGALYCGPGFIPAINGTTVLLNAGEDLSAILSKIEQAGGTVILPKSPINNGNGFIAYFRDPEGNRVGLHSKH